MEPGKSIRIKPELQKPTQFYQDCTRFYTARFRFGKADSRLPRRHGNVVMPAWQRCYAGMATGEAACTHRFKPLRIGFLGDKNAFSARETREIIPSIRGALVLSK